MLNKEGLKLAGILAALYVFLGVIIFPKWYLHVLQEGGVSYLIYQAQTSFLILNIIAALFISFIVFVVSIIQKHNAALYESIQPQIKGKVFLTLTWLVIFIAVYRLATVSFFSTNVELETLIQKISVLEEINKSKLAVSAPIEAVYMNKRKITDIYTQLSPKLQLSERKIDRKRGISAEGELGVDGLVSVGSKTETNHEQQEKYKTRKISESEKLVSIINYFHKDKSLIKVTPIAVDSKELTKINESIQTLNEYKIELDLKKAEKVKNEIKVKALQSKVSEVYKVNSWVLISGPISITKNSVNNLLSIDFDYIPSEKTGVKFSCNIPSSEIEKSESSYLLSESSWELNIFGRIIHKNNGEAIKYSINCLSIYR